MLRLSSQALSAGVPAHGGPCRVRHLCRGRLRDLYEVSCSQGSGLYAFDSPERNGV